MGPKFLRKEKFWYFVAGIVAAIATPKVLKCEGTRALAVHGIAKGIKLNHDAQELVQNMKEEAQDICCDAKAKAVIED